MYATKFILFYFIFFFFLVTVLTIYGQINATQRDYRLQLSAAPPFLHYRRAASLPSWLELMNCLQSDAMGKVAG